MTREDYARHEGEEQARLGLADEATPTSHNEGLAREGEAFMSLYVSGYLRHSLPRLPEEGIKYVDTLRLLFFFFL